jgi:hypothetical protein
MTAAADLRAYIEHCAAIEREMRAAWLLLSLAELRAIACGYPFPSSPAANKPPPAGTPPRPGTPRPAAGPGAADHDEWPDIPAFLRRP